MKDRLYMVLALAGFIILAVVVLKNYDISQDEKVFAVGDFYTPQNVKTRVESSLNLYSQMTGSRQLTCPETSMKRSSGSTINLESMNNTSERNKYGWVSLFVTADFLGAGYDTRVTASLPTGVKTDSTLFASTINANSVTSANAVAFKNAFATQISEYENAEIVAPFPFRFENLNSTENDKIIISNLNGTCRITFDGVSNWFCAGSPGTQWVNTSGAGVKYTEWADHGREGIVQTGTGAQRNVSAGHATIIGKSSNAEVTGGGALDIIGYANADTTYLIEVYDGTKWKAISLWDAVIATQSR